MDYNLGNYWYLLLLLVLPVVAVLLLHFVRWRQSRRNVFAERRFQSEFFERNKRFSKIFPVLYILAFLFLIFSMIDLLGGREKVKTSQKMSNVVFLFDVSNSMNAEDVKPSRLAEAKNIMLGALKGMANNRVGIVVFAGEASSIMPLTTDYTAADTYIDAIDTGIIKIQGTDFLKAMQVAAQKFRNIPKGSRQIVLISDGEDNEGNADAAVKLAKSEGISVISVGVGTSEGAPVPEYLLGQLMGYKTDLTGQTIISKRQENALKDLATSTGGSYIDGNNLEEAVLQTEEALKKTSASGSIMVSSDNSVHYYQYFLAISILLFFLIYLFNPKRDLNI